MPRRSATARALAIALCALLVGGAYPALAAAPKAPAPKPGSFSGLVGPQSLSFTVPPSGESVAGLTTTFDPAAFCGVPTSGAHASFPTLKIHKGHFSGKTTLNSGTPVHYSVKGKFLTPSKASGTITGAFKIKSLPPCNAKSPFTVKRKG